MEEPEDNGIGEWLNQKWNSRWNPARTLAWDKADNHSLLKKLQHTAYVFFGDLPQMEAEDFDYQAGLLDFLPFFFLPKYFLGCCFKLWRETQETETEKSIRLKDSQAQSSAASVSGGSALKVEKKPFLSPVWREKIGKGIAIVGILLLAAPLLIIQAALALALTIAVSPIVVIVDLFRGPDKIVVIEKNQVKSKEKPITPLRQSFWFNPSTWAMGAVVTFAMSLYGSANNPAVFGLVAASVGVIQSVFVGMAALLLTLAAVKFAIEMGSAVYERRQQAAEHNKNVGKDNPIATSTRPLHFEGQKLLSYMEDRWVWMENHRKTSIAIGIFTGLALAFSVGLTVAFFVGVPTDSFVSTTFDFMSQLLVSLIQSMSHLPGLEFLARPEAVLLPIAQILSAVFLIMAPLVLGDTALRFFYKREGADFEEISEMSTVNDGEEQTAWRRIKNPVTNKRHDRLISIGKVYEMDKLPIDLGSFFSSKLEDGLDAAVEKAWKALPSMTCLDMS